MKDEYDLVALPSRPNPYAVRLAPSTRAPFEMSIAEDPGDSIRRTGRTAMAIAVLMLVVAVIGEGQYGPEPQLSLDLAEAWNAGLVQGFLVMNVLLLAIGFGLWRLQWWARWPAICWFPALAVVNLVTEQLKFGAIESASWQLAGLISVAWFAFFHAKLGTPNAVAAFVGRPPPR